MMEYRKNTIIFSEVFNWHPDKNKILIIYAIYTYLFLYNIRC